MNLYLAMNDKADKLMYSCLNDYSDSKIYFYIKINTCQILTCHVNQLLFQKYNCVHHIDQN